MPTPFIEERFPEEISYGAQGGPEFKTDVFTSQAGFEQRNVLFAEARCKYDVSHGIKSHDDMQDVLAFFYNVKGKATGFRFKDWSDYILTNEIIGTGNGVLTAFQITKTYTVGGSNNYVRELYKIVADIIVKVNDVVKTITTDYTINLNTGLITFTSPVTNTHTVKVTGEFDVPVRFDTDSMALTIEAFEQESWSGIPLIEIKSNA